MDRRKKWKMFLNSGSFRRKVKKYRHIDQNNQSAINPEASSKNHKSDPAAVDHKLVEHPEFAEPNSAVPKISPESNDESFDDPRRQQAMKPLLQKLNQLDSTLPRDPRRLLYTPRIKPSITAIDGGVYWHQGIGKNMIFNQKRTHCLI